MSNVELIAMIGKIVLMFSMLMLVPVIMNWVERRGAALIQNRLGPNRVGPLGLLQTIADAVKFLFKEDRIPGHVSKFWYFIAPAIVMIPALMTFSVIPFASEITIDGHRILMQVANLNVGFLFIFAIGSLGVYGIIMGGWASNNKFALLGSLRSSSQMISYELSMGLSVIGIVMAFQTVDLGEIARLQAEPLWQIAGLTIPKWGILIQPLGFLILCTALFAETNRLPFDLPEGEPEIVGFHVEYGSMKFALFMLGEYMNMAVACGLMTALYFGGYQLLPGMGWVLSHLGLTGMNYEWARVGFEILSFTIKLAFFLWFYVWVRWTLPRFRYDQVMDLGWKVMFPLSLVNIFLTGIMIYLGWM